MQLLFYTASAVQQLTLSSDIFLKKRTPAVVGNKVFNNKTRQHFPKAAGHNTGLYYYINPLSVERAICFQPAPW